MITKQQAEDFYIFSILSRKFLEKLYQDEDKIAYLWDMKLIEHIGNLISIQDDVISLEDDEEIDEESFIHQLQQLCNEVSEEDEIKELYGESTYKSDWIIELYERIKALAD